MSEQNLPQKLSYSTPLKILVASAVGVVLAFGICGAALALKTSDAAGMLAVAVFGISVLGLAIAVIWLIVIAFTNSSRN